MGGAGPSGNDERGRPTQVSRTVHGTKKDAQRVAAQMTLRPSRNAGGRKLGALLDEWIEFIEASWAPLTLRDQRSRAELIKADPIGDRSVASVGVADVDQFVTRLRKKDVGESSIRNQHSVLRAALEQAVCWEWIDRNPAASAPIKRAKRVQRKAIPDDEVIRALQAVGVHVVHRVGGDSFTESSVLDNDWRTCLVVTDGEHGPEVQPFGTCFDGRWMGRQSGRRVSVSHGSTVVRGRWRSRSSGDVTLSGPAGGAQRSVSGLSDWMSAWS